MKKLILILLLPIFLSLLACNNKNDKNLKDITRDNNKESEGNVKDINYSIWTTYWDTRDLEYEIKDMKDNIDNIYYFAAHFDQDKTLFIPGQTIESFEKVKSLYGSKRYGSYLTFVNDLVFKDGTSSLKDVDLLYTLFETEESVENHIEDILYLATKEGFDGVEIDYEAINNDIKLWELYIDFIDKLYKSANEKNISIRIVLEPNAPLDIITLPKGPEYVMMCYNLYGYGTKPGPKANKGFIKEMIEKMEREVLAENISFALATGGYDFQNNGVVKSLTEREAVELLSIYSKSPIRDEESQALFFNYTDNEGINHQVWYADKDTINYWASIIQKSGNYHISLWRMGGNISLKDILN